ADHHAAQVERDAAIEPVDRHVGNAAGRARTAGVVEEAVEPAMARRRVIDEGAELVLLGRVGLNEAARGTEPLGVRLALLAPSPGDHNLGALRDEELRRAETDAAGRAGDDRDLAVEPAHDDPFLHTVPPPGGAGFRRR